MFELSKTVLVIGAAVVLLLAGFLLTNNSSSTGLAVAGNQSIEKISFAYVPAPFNAVPIIALRKNFLAEEGLQVEEVKASFIGYVFQELAVNKIDVLVGAETPGVFVALKGGKYSILAKFEENTNDLTLVSRKDAKIFSVNDLAGKKVGLPFTSVSQYNLWKLLKESSIGPSSVTFVDLAPQNMASALDHGDVDAVFAWEPTPSKIIAGLGPKVDYFTPKTSWMMAVYSSQKFGENKVAQKKLLRAFLKAEKFIKENPDEAIQIVAKETNLDDATLKKIWGVWEYRLSEFTGVQAMQNQAAWVVQSGLVNSTVIPDFQSMVDSQA
ncbi:ABC transporter substrate-binding protein, partial [Candidatus Micrarchaeota archaeon]|nr:ABC transporter substrate-binding protein [Candidatus Micrarchaeota archaeon]